MSAANIIKGLEVLAATDFAQILAVIKSHNVNDEFRLAEDLAGALSTVIPEAQDIRYALITLNFMCNLKMKAATVEDLEISHPLPNGN